MPQTYQMTCSQCGELRWPPFVWKTGKLCLRPVQERRRIGQTRGGPEGGQGEKVAP